LLQKERAGRSPVDLIKVLLASLDRSRKFERGTEQYNLGAIGRVIVTRNARGKVTLAFPQGLTTVDKSALVAAIEQIVKDLAEQTGIGRGTSGADKRLRLGSSLFISITYTKIIAALVKHLPSWHYDLVQRSMYPLRRSDRKPEA